MRFNTFQEVVNHYESIKPLLSKNHTLADDIRPLGERRYKWQRIIKIDDNTYALADGSWAEMPFNGSVPTEKETNRATAPILWERREDGEYLHIRGSMGTGYSISRYQFYNWNLPYGMMHVDNTRQGEHWIRNSRSVTGSTEEYVLPRSVYRYDWHNRKVLEHQDKSLVFKREGDKFVRVGTVEIKGKHIDTDRKAQVKPLIKKFYDWMGSIAPIVAKDYSSRSQYAKLLHDEGISNSPWQAMRLDGMNDEKVLQILQDEEHTCRVALASLILGHIDYTVDAPTNHGGKHNRIPDPQAPHGYRWEWVDGRPYTEEDTAAWYKQEAKRLRNAYNRNMNKILDLFKMESV